MATICLAGQASQPFGGRILMARIRFSLALFPQPIIDVSNRSIELAADLRKQARGFTRPVRPVELIPDRSKWVGQIAQEIRQHLTYRLRLARQLRQVIPVVNRPLAKPLARMPNGRAVATDDGDGRGADADNQIQAGPATRHKVDGPSSRTSARGDTVATVVASGANGVDARRQRRCSSTKRMPMVAPVASRWVSRRASICASSVALMLASVTPTGNRHERLLSNGLATRLDAAFIVPLTGSAETGFE